MSISALSSTQVAPPERRRDRRKKFRGDVEGLRGVAVLLVVAFHAGVGLISGGFVGVDIFFVLSGFLITGLLVDEVARTGTISISEFYARRIRRLLPLSTLVLAATAVATVLLMPPIDRKGIAGDIVGAAIWGANWKFAAESTQYMADTDKSPVLHYWSLAVEEQFYVVWPLLMLLLVGSSGLALRARAVAMRRVALALGAVIVLSLWASWRLTSSGDPYAYFGLHTRAWELGIGGGLALLRSALPLMTRRAAQAAAAVGAVAVVGSALLMDKSTPFPGTAALVPVIGTALLLAAGARLPDEGISRALAVAPLRYVGRVSYAWYLWHWPVLILANARWATAEDDVSSPQARWPVVLAAVVASFGLAVASHYVVEQPFRHARMLKASRRRSLQAGALLIAVSLVSSGAMFVPGPRNGQDDVVSAPSGRSATEVQAAGLAPTTPEEARADESKAAPCYLGYEGTSVAPADKCRVGPATGGKRTIVLIGDSHATSWRPALEKASKERGWTVYFFAKTGCSVIDVPISRTGSTTEYHACEQWRENVMDLVAGIPDVDAVVIGRYMGYRNLALGPDGSRSTPSTIGPLWTSGAERTFERLEKAAKRVIVMKDIPWPNGDVPSCLSQHNDDVEQCAFDRSERSALDGVLVEAEKDASDQVRFVKTTDLICPQERCQVVTPTGQIMFRDGQHLTAGYSTTLWRAVSDRVDAAID